MCEQCGNVEPRFHAFIKIANQAWDLLFPGQDMTMVIDCQEFLEAPAISTNITNSEGGPTADLPAILRRCAAELLEFADEKDTTSTPHEVVGDK